MRFLAIAHTRLRPHHRERLARAAAPLRDTSPGRSPDPHEREPVSLTHLDSWTATHFNRIIGEFQASLRNEPLTHASARRLGGLPTPNLTPSRPLVVFPRERIPTVGSTPQCALREQQQGWPPPRVNRALDCSTASPPGTQDAGTQDAGTRAHLAAKPGSAPSTTHDARRMPPR